jgi:hypothetical protein
VFFVDDSGSNNNSGLDPTQPFATLAYAESQCTAGVGDVIIMMPGHAESVTSTIVLNTSCLHVIGLGQGKERANLTQATTGSDNVVEVAAANITIENVFFTGSTTGTSEVFIDVQAAADQCTIRNCWFEHNTKNLEAITVQPTADYLCIEDCTFMGVAAGADSAIIFEDAVADEVTMAPIIRRCLFNYDKSAGCDQDVIAVSQSSGTVTGILIQDCTFIGLGDGEAAFDMQQTTSGTVTGLALRCSVDTADATDAFIQTDILTMIECFAAEAGARPAGAKLGSGSAPLATTAF